ncbi:MAG: 4Fe-4S binding protein [Chloroflexi bacterium]|nr:4Fe-4S binding protein [Chloroflexota bacterium]
MIGVTIPEIDESKCTACGDCVELCPASAVDLVNGKAAIVRPEDCDYCTDCEVFCSAGAISCPFDIILVKDRPAEQR